MLSVFVLILSLFNPDLSSVNQMAATQHLDASQNKVFYTSMEDCEKWKEAEIIHLNEQSENGKNFKYVIGCFELPWNVKSGSI